MIEPGFYKIRARNRAPWLPVRMWFDGPKDEDGEPTDDEILHALVDGRSIPADDLIALTFEDRYMQFCGLGRAPRRSKYANFEWHPIDESEYNFLVAEREHVRRYSPGEVDENKPVDLTEIAPIEL